MIEIKNTEGLEFLNQIENDTIDLILTDPPYIISKDSGMNTLHNKLNSGDFKGKTEEDWEKYKKTLDKPENEIAQGKGKGWSKENYLQYGTILGKKYSVKTDYGDWDKNFTLEILEEFVKQFYTKLKKGGTCIIWFDLWKISYLREIMEKYKFKQIRLIEWIKTNPQPINSKVNYLTNCREVAVLGVKGGKPTFNSNYDNGIYKYPLCSGKNKFHPTQKNLQLFEELIKKHSNNGDLVIDTFLGGGTTAIACKNTNRNFKGCEINSDYTKKVLEILSS